MSQTKLNDQTYIAHTYARFDIAFTSGKNCTLVDEDGKNYTDFTSGIGVNSLGYANEKWVEAVSKQAATLAHVSNLYYTLPQTQLAKKICDRTHFSKMVFSNSGAEANEAMIKAARKYSYDKYGKQRYEIITLVNSFHGRTISTLSATGQDHFHQFFDPFTPGFKHAIANDIDDLKAKLSDQTCAIMIELIQGEGGVIPLDQSYVKQVKELCQQNDLLLLIDEVQTGIGRTGTFLTYEQFDIEPDIVSLAKGLGNGLPIGGILLNQKCENVFGYGDHGSTFAANLVACAGANVVVDTMNDTFLKEVQAKGAYLESRLLKMKHIKQVNGLGLMRGAVLEEGYVAKDIVLKCIDSGLLLLTAKDKLRFLPPLTITMDELKNGLDILENVLNDI